MSVSIKTEHEIELMREAGHLLEKVHDGLIPYIKPGVSTKEIDRIGEQMIRDLGCIPNFLNYGGFPASFCISLNDEVVHGIPSEEKIIQEGDLVKIDAGLIYKGYHSDAARTYAVGEVSPQARKLMDVTRECFFEGLKAARAGNHLNDISKAIGAHAAKYHYGIVRDLGLTVAKELRKRNVLSCIIFLTSYPHFMIDAFEVNTFRFLLKPIDKSKFFKAIDDYVKIVDANYPITLIQNKELKKINSNEICFIEADGKYSNIHLNTKVMHCSKTLSGNKYRG